MMSCLTDEPPNDDDDRIHLCPPRNSTIDRHCHVVLVDPLYFIIDRQLAQLINRLFFSGP